MKIHRSLHALVVLFAAGCASESGPAADSTSSNNPSEVATPLVDSPGAVALLERVQQRYVRHIDLSQLEGDDAQMLASVDGKPILAHAEVVSSRLSSGRIHPTLSGENLDLHLPARADGAFQLKEHGSAVALDVTLDGARPSAGESAHGVLVYENALGEGAHLFHRASEQGTEDFVELSSRPADASLRYTVRLTDEVAGLRLVANTLEFLDAGGVPRLRVASPYVVDANSAIQDATLSVEGCAVDTNPAVPWGREPVDPGGRVCHVKVSWDASIAYPALVDPSWTTTGQMAYARYSHSASTLLNGQVLVAGGISSTGSYMDSAEVYLPGSTPVNGTWTPTGSLAQKRANHAASSAMPWLYQNGTNYYRVLVVGGKIPSSGPLVGPPHTTVFTELYDLASGQWVAGGSMPAGGRTAVRVENPDGVISVGNSSVLVIGGEDQNALPLNTVEKYRFSTNTWGAMTPLLIPHSAHSVSSLSLGQLGTPPKIFVVGGVTGPSRTPSAKVEVFNASLNGGLGGWSYVTDLPTPFYNHTSSNTTDKRLLVAGGSGSQSSAIYDAGTTLWSTPGGGLLARTGHAQILGLVTGGYAAGGSVANYSQSFDVSTSSWGPAIQFVGPRAKHTMVSSAGKMFVVGGYDGSTAVNSTSLFTP